MANIMTVGDANDSAALLAGKCDMHQNYPRPKRKWNVQCDYCKMKGHTKEGCYKIIEYPAGFKGKKKMNNAYNACAENNHPNVIAENAGGICQPEGVNIGEMSRSPQLTTEQYDQIMKMLNLNTNREQQQENTANMAGNAYSFLVDIAKTNWIIDTGATNHMVADIRLLNNVKVVNTKDTKKDLFNGEVKGISREKDDLYLLVSQSNKATGTESREVTKGLIAQGNKEEIMVWHKRLGHASGRAMVKLLGYNLEMCKFVIDRCDVCPLAKHHRFWGHCILAATYVINRLPSVALEGKSPYEVFFHKKSSISHLKTLRYLCFAAALPRGDKFGSRAIRAVFMGYSSVTKGYILYDLEKHLFFMNRDVIFREDTFPFQLQDTEMNQTMDPFLVNDNDHLPSEDSIPACSPILGSTLRSIFEVDPSQLIFPSTSSIGNAIPLRRSQRGSKEPVWMTDYVTQKSSTNSVLYPIENVVSYDRLSLSHQTYLGAFLAVTEPQSFQQASQDKRWVEAMQTEIQAL
ncbi:uncharacterized protein [Nicotiana sylvestris]|uniref:Uncharacterized protein LOC104242770 n=1 Tax=Nicotiana sylvestris TaxID=4096 RepID=A0A1U7XVW5_NICSY|nr:PREDICTED: uncharacterized protein LOC104242770 [Nicotiana sylvestris]